MIFRRIMPTAMLVLALFSAALQPVTAADRKPLVIVSGQTKQMPTGDTVPVASGGTGATDASGARTAIGAQAQDGDLDAISALSGTDTIYYRSGASTWSPVSIGANMTFSSGVLASTGGGGGGGLSDGDFGDITVSGTGTVMTVDSDVVTYAKMQNVSAASKLLGRGDSGSGDPQEITLGSTLSMSGTTLSAAFRGAKGTMVSDPTAQNYTTQTAIAFDSEYYDTDSIHDNSTNNTRWAVPSGVTDVQFRTHIELANVTSDTASQLFLRKNGSSLDFNGACREYENESTTVRYLSCDSGIMPVTGGTDYFEVMVLQATDTSVDIDASRSWAELKIIR